jgi:hypothetical protein
VIREGLYLFKRGGEPVVPFKGKYAVKVPDVFERIAAMSQVPAEWRYQLLRVEFELTTKCNDTCPHCGMGALPISKGHTLSFEQIDHLAQEFRSVGLPSVAITGRRAVRSHAPPRA